MALVKIKLIATTKLRYDKRSLVEGDEFEATESDAKILTIIGKARYPKAATYQTRMMTAETPAIPVAVAPVAPVLPAAPRTLTLPKKTYKTA